MMLFLMKFQTDENSSVAPVEQKKSRREQFLDKQDGVFLYIVAGISGQIRDDMKKKGTPVTSFLDYGNAEDSEEIKDKKFNDIRRLFTGFLNGGDIRGANINKGFYLLRP